MNQGVTQFQEKDICRGTGLNEETEVLLYYDINTMKFYLFTALTLSFIMNSDENHSKQSDSKSKEN